MKVRQIWAGLLVMSALLGGVSGCELPGSKVAQGQLYLSGEARFDAYFRDVHAQQVAAAGWTEERKRTRRPLIGVLALTPDAGDITIVQATHDRMTTYTHDGGGTKLNLMPDDARVMVLPGTKPDPTFFHALEETARFEIDRDRKLSGVGPQIEQLVKTGHALEPHIEETFIHGTPGKASEVKSELNASLEALQSLSAKAHHSARESEDFLADLQRGAAVSNDSPKHDGKSNAAVASRPAISPSKPSVAATPKPAAAAKKPDDATASVPPPTPPAPKPAAASKPTDPGEVFNP